MRSLAWLGILVACAAPGRARADDLLATTLLRPVRMLDVDPAGSIAATIDNGWVSTSVTDSSSKDSAWVGSLEVSGELALAEHVKFFASLPAAYTMAGRDFAGLGNLTLGAALLGGRGRFTGALSFSYSLAGEPDGAVGQLLRAEHSRFWTSSDVIHAGVDWRWRGTHAVLQLALGLTSLLEEDVGREYLAGNRLGLAFPTTGPTFFVEAGIEARAGDTDGLFYRAGRAVRADVGLRGRIGGSEQTCALALSGLVMDDVTALTLELELRSDFAAIR